MRVRDSAVQHVETMDEMKGGCDVYMYVNRFNIMTYFTLYSAYSDRIPTSHLSCIAIGVVDGLWRDG